ncbi:MAG: MotA/TolQ/ExbB proton channel family protein [Thiohalocapsa sp.]
MSPLLDGIAPLLSFMQAGGPVLWGIALLSLLLWGLILERYLYLAQAHPTHRRQIVADWQARPEHTSWVAAQIRAAAIAEVRLRLERSLGLIGALIAICPLLGLLGTVTGMIRVFDLMTVVGTGNARAMASGVSMATIPTMAGMVVAISALFFNMDLRQRARRLVQQTGDRLIAEGV